MAAVQSVRPGVIAGIVALSLATLTTYGPHLRAPLVFDDNSTVLSNPSIESLWPLVSFRGIDSPLSPSPELPTSARPIANLSFAIDMARQGTDPAGYRFTNLIIHIAVGLTLWRVIEGTLTRYRPQWLTPDAARLLSFAAALAWTLHPANSECVMYVTQRTESLMALSMLATLACALHYWEAEGAMRRFWLAAVGLVAVLGMLSKEVMFVAPLVVALFERTFVAPGGVIPRRNMPLYMVLAIASLTVPLLYLAGYRSTHSGDVGIPPVVWWMTQAKVLFFYIGLAVWPWPLALHYQMPYLRDITIAWPWVGMAALLVITASWLALRRAPAGFLLMASLCTLAPTSLVPLSDEVAAERRLYLPLAAAIAGITVAPFTRGIHPARWRDGRSIAIFATSVAVALALARLSHIRAGAYASPVSIWADNVANQPDNYLARYNLSRCLIDEGRLDEAKRHLRRAATIAPPSSRHAEIYSRASFNLGLLHQKDGEHTEAIQSFRRVIEMTPDSSPAHYNLARSLEDAGETSAAAAAYAAALDHDPDHYWAHTNLALLHLERNEIDAALSHLLEAYRISADFHACSNLAALHAGAGRIDEALVMAREALRAADDTSDLATVDSLKMFLAKHARRAHRTTNQTAPPPVSEVTREGGRY